MQQFDDYSHSQGGYIKEVIKLNILKRLDRDLSIVRERKRLFMEEIDRRMESSKETLIKFGIQSMQS